MRKINYLIMDIDGTLTDGKIYFGNEGELFKAFNIKDGYGINHILKEIEIEPIIITGRSSDIVDKRCRELGIERIYQGSTKKFDVLCSAIGYDKLAECAYIGDDEPDYLCMMEIKKVGGIVGCPKDAIKKIKEISDFVSGFDAGNGAVREFIEWLRSMVVDMNCL